MNFDHYNAVRTTAGYLQLQDRSWIGFVGTERADFLQGLLTNDVVSLSCGTGCYATYLTPQGRMIADMIVLADQDRLLVDVHGSVNASLHKRFDSLIFAEDVTVQNLGETFSAFGIHGPHALEIISSLFLSTKRQFAVHEHCRVDIEGAAGLLVRTDDLGIEGYRLIVDRTVTAKVLEVLKTSKAVPLEPKVVETVRVESGRPLFPVDMDAETIPLEAGIEDRAIDFDKGCYVGQEVIIRILHRGQGRVARRLVGLVCEQLDAHSRTLPTLGMSIYRVDSDDEVGVVTSAVWSPECSAVIVLGYLSRELADQAGVVVDVMVDHSRVRSVVTKLPFVSLSGSDGS
ncbi:aminomethyl transferase family protein [bacterium]|nr:MAG: aminomethyl transferase family protein [bacterium]